MLSSASRQFRHVSRRAIARRTLSFTTTSRAAGATSSMHWMGAGAAVVTVAATAMSIERTSLDAPPSTPAPIEEKKTGILFPATEGTLKFVGCGVRVKYGFVKVYAVGTYADAEDMAALKPLPREDRVKVLLDPATPRTIRIVMNRSLSIDKYTNAIVEALEPRMKGEDLEALEAFRAMSVNPPQDLKEGDEIKMTIIGDLLHYRTAAGGGGTIKSLVLTLAMCDVYYGEDPVSPSHKESVLDGIDKM